MRLTRDTERMVMSDIIYAADEPKGWALIPEPNAKEERFCERLGLEIIRENIQDFMQAASTFIPSHDTVLTETKTDGTRIGA